MTPISKPNIKQNILTHVCKNPSDCSKLNLKTKMYYYFNNFHNLISKIFLKK